MKKFAKLISLLFEPIIVLSVLSFVGAARSGLRARELWTFLFVALVVMVVPTFLFRVWLLKKRRVDWDIVERKNRIVPLFLLLGLVIIDTWIVSAWGNPMLTALFTAFFLWLLGFFLMTLLVKISGHTSAITLASLFLIAWYGWRLLPLLFIIPIVAWARVALGKHTVLQTVVGVIYSGTVLLLFK